MPNPFLSRPLVALAAAAVVACASATPPPPAPPPPPPPPPPGQTSLQQQQATLVPCEAETAPPGAAHLDRRGGVVRSGRARLMVPQDALPAAHHVSLSHEGGAYRVVRAEIEDQPPRQPPNRSYILTLSYEGCDVGGGEPTIVRLGDTGFGLVEDVGGAVDTDARTVTAVLDHLSRYAIGSN